MKATVFSRIGLVAAVLALVVSLGSTQTYAAPALSPDAASVAAPGEPKGGSDGKSQENSGGGQGSADHDTYRNPTPPGNDRNSGQGANDPEGRYTSPKTATPSPVPTPAPSGNGSENGQAAGKPYAGTVGNADDKNPPGQVNKPAPGGYECRNQGNGQGNPAHTQVEGCSDESTPDDGGDDDGNGTDPDDDIKPEDEDTGNGNGNGSGNGNGNGSNDSSTTRTETSLGISPVNTPEESAETASGPKIQVPVPQSGRAASSSGGAIPAGVLGSLPSPAQEALQGTGAGLSGNAQLGASGTSSLAPGALPYTGEADEVSGQPMTWAAAGLLFLMAGLFVRRSAFATVDR